MSESTYEKVIHTVALDLGLDEVRLREAFSTWVTLTKDARDMHLTEDRDGPIAEFNVACYAIYRITKLTSAFNMTSRSRARWRERAMELGSPGHLVKTDG